MQSGLAEGDAQKLPKLPEFPQGWYLGKPDLIVTMDQAFDVPADGPDLYRNFVLPLNLTEDKWVTTIDIRPGAREVVHHALYYRDETGRLGNSTGRMVSLASREWASEVRVNSTAGPPARRRPSCRTFREISVAAVARTASSR